MTFIPPNKGYLSLTSEPQMSSFFMPCNLKTLFLRGRSKNVAIIFLKILATGWLLTALSAQAKEPQITLLPTPAIGQSSLSRLTTDSSGQVHLSWVTATGTSSALYYATLAGTTWGPANLIQEGNDWFVNWADFPYLAVTDAGRVAHWLQKSAEGTYDYDIKAVFFHQEMQAWGPPITIHKDGVSAEHGFVSMLPLSEGRSFITWLDGRNTKAPKAGPEHHPADQHNMGGGMTLRAAVFDRHGETLEEWALDELTCDCCNTSSAMTAAGPIVVYRDRTEKEIRDIVITRFVDSQWTEPKAVSKDNWEVAGCPVNGPAVAAQDQLTAVAWFTAKDNLPKVQLAISNDAGASFGQPILLEQGSTNGRVSIAMLDSGNIAVSWLHTNGANATLRVALYNPIGELLAKTNVAETKSSRRSGFPVMTHQDNDVYVTWTDISADSQIKIARIEFNL